MIEVIIKWNLRGVSEEEIITMAKKINKQLGYELFEDLNHEILISDFSTVSRERYKKNQSFAMTD